MKPSKWFNRKTLLVYSLCFIALCFAIANGLGIRSSSEVIIPNTDVPAAAPADAPSAAEASTGDFFKDFRAQRELARADEMELLDSIIQREGAPQDSIHEADIRKIRLTEFYEQERGIEKLLIAKGFEDAAAFIQDGSVNIIVKKEKLTQSDSDKILEVALRESGQDASCIKIIPVA